MTGRFIHLNSDRSVLPAGCARVETSDALVCRMAIEFERDASRTTRMKYAMHDLFKGNIGLSRNIAIIHLRYWRRVGVKYIIGNINYMDYAPIPLFSQVNTS